MYSYVSWVVTQRYRRFGTTYRSHFKGSSCPKKSLNPWRWDPIGSPEPSISNHFTLCNNPEDGRSHFNRGGSLRSRTVQCTSPAAEKTTGLPFVSTSPPLVRVTLASLEECNILLQNGLDFYGATFFPTEAAVSTSLVRTRGNKSVLGNRYTNADTYHKP
jgi:hypothetical protein